MQFPHLNLDPDFEPNPSMTFYMKTRDRKNQYRVFSFDSPELMMYFASRAASMNLIITDTKIEFFNIYSILGKTRKNDQLQLSLIRRNISEDNRIIESVTTNKDIHELFKKIKTENNLSE